MGVVIRESETSFTEDSEVDLKHDTEVALMMLGAAPPDVGFFPPPVMSMGVGEDPYESVEAITPPAAAAWYGITWESPREMGPARYPNSAAMNQARWGTIAGSTIFLAVQRARGYGIIFVFHSDDPLGTPEVVPLGTTAFPRSSQTALATTVAGSVVIATRAEIDKVVVYYLIPPASKFATYSLLGPYDRSNQFGNYDECSTPCVAVDSVSGEIHLVYSAKDENDQETVVYRRLSPLEDEVDFGPGSLPSVAARDGKVVVAWRVNNASGQGIRVCCRLNSEGGTGTWEERVVAGLSDSGSRIDDAVAPTDGFARDPAVWVDGTGRFVIGYHRAVAKPCSVSVTYVPSAFTSGGIWTWAENSPNPIVGSERGVFVTGAGSASGDHIAVWERKEDGNPKQIGVAYSRVAFAPIGPPVPAIYEPSIDWMAATPVTAVDDVKYSDGTLYPGVLVGEDGVLHLFWVEGDSVRRSGMVMYRRGVAL